MRKVLILLSVMMSATIAAQTTFVRECGQHAFNRTVPAGNYSGITHIEGNKYAVVSDKSEYDGFYIFTIDIDSVTGEIHDVHFKTFKADTNRGGDCEGIAYIPHLSTFFISREADANISEYDSTGTATGRKLDIPRVFKESMGNYGFESLAYDTVTHMFWTINESTLPSDGMRATSTNGVENILRLQSFGDDLRPKAQYVYRMDAPKAKKNASQYAMGVSEITAIGNGRLLVLEREFYVPKIKLGAFVNCKLYEIIPSKEYEVPIDGNIDAHPITLPKKLIHSFSTKLQLFNRSIANYEGMCVGPRLTDGSTVLILVSDSQNQYAGVLKDWFKTIVIR